MPTEDVITILPFELANPEPVFILSVFTRVSNNVVAASSVLNTVVSLPTPAKSKPPLPTATVPPFNSTLPLAKTLSLIEIAPVPASKSPALNVLSVATPTKVFLSYTILSGSITPLWAVASFTA